MSEAPANEEAMIASLRDAVDTGSGGIVNDGRLATERELMEMFAVPRRAVRRALERLQAEGLVYRRQGQGTFIRPTAPSAPRVASLANRTSPAEIMEVRREIEPALARLAALRATPADIGQMKRLAGRGAAAGDSHAYERWDSAFHAKIAESARNDLFRSIFHLIQGVRAEQKWTGLRAQLFTRSLRDTLAAHHRSIVEAIAARDPDAAGREMRAHLNAVTELIGI